MNAQFLQCLNCKKLFAPSGSGKATLLCYKCCWEYDELFKRVQKFQKSHPNATARETILQLEIPESLAGIMLRDKRLRFADVS